LGLGQRGVARLATTAEIDLNNVNGNDSFTKILLHMDGTDASTTFTDDNAGGSAHTWTANGNAQIDTGIVKFGSAAGLFDGTGDYISAADSADFTLGSSDWTVDYQFNRAGGDGTVRGMFGHVDATTLAAARSIDIRLTAGNVVEGRVSDGSTINVLTGKTVFTATGWHHVEMSRAGNTVRLFVDGVQEASIPFTGTCPDPATAFIVGSTNASINNWNGSIDEFRLSVGIARHTANFTPP